MWSASRVSVAALLALLGLGCESRDVAARRASSGGTVRLPAAEPAVPAGDSDGPPEVSPAEPWTVTAADGVELAGDFTPGADARSPVVVLFHQLGHDRSEWEGLRATLRGQGYAVLRADGRGHGGSAGGPEGWQGFQAADWTRLPDDGAAVLDWLESRDDLNPRAVVLGGSSIGSSTALVLGARDDVDGVFALSPGRAYHGIDALTPLTRYPANRPVLLVAARGEVESAEVARDMARIAPTGSARLVEGSGHGLAMIVDQPGLMQVLEEFIRGVTTGDDE